MKVLTASQKTATFQFPDSWAEPKSRSTLGFNNLHRRSTGDQNWRICLLDSPRSLGLKPGSSGPTSPNVVSPARLIAPRSVGLSKSTPVKASKIPGSHKKPDTLAAAPSLQQSVNVVITMVLHFNKDPLHDCYLWG